MSVFVANHLVISNFQFVHTIEVDADTSSSIFAQGTNFAFDLDNGQTANGAPVRLNCLNTRGLQSLTGMLLQILLQPYSSAHLQQHWGIEIVYAVSNCVSTVSAALQHASSVL